jgi:broad specificity phosphatase PhoE
MDLVARFVELRRHTANEGDRLTDEGVAAALEIGSGLGGGYRLAVSSGAQRATQTLACFLAALGEPVPDGVVVESRLRSRAEDRWRALAGETESGSITEFLDVDPAFVEEEAARLAAGLSTTLERLDHGEMAIAVGHSPTNEAAVYGLTGDAIAPMAKGAGVLVVGDAGGYRVERLR